MQFFGPGLVSRDTVTLEFACAAGKSGPLFATGLAEAYNQGFKKTRRLFSLMARTGCAGEHHLCDFLSDALISYIPD
jgi:hypothetical protein